MNRALVLRELTRRGAWSAGVKDEELRLENVHGIVSGPRNRAADRVRTDRDRGNHTDYWAGIEQEQEARPPAPADCLADCRRARRRGWTAGCMAGVRRVYGVRRIAGLAGDLHHRGRHRRRRLRDRRSRDPARVRRALAVVLVPLVLLSTALGVDSIYGEYQTIGTLVGYTPYASLGSIEVHKAAMSVSDWHSKARKGSLPSMPSQARCSPSTFRTPNPTSRPARR